MNHSTRKLLKLVSNILDIAKIEAGKFTLTKAPWDIVHAVYQIMASLQSVSWLLKINLKASVQYLEKGKIEQHLKGIQGILIPGGFGSRGIEGKIRAVKYARENKIPFFGICLGMQVATIEFARNVCGMKDANSTEFDKDTKYPVISLLEEQKNVKKMGATMRLGSYPCSLEKHTKSVDLYKQAKVSERHRHRYEFNNEYKKILQDEGLVFAGVNRDRDLVEIVELKDHPWFVGCQFHPEFKSKPDVAHPLFRGFVAAALTAK